MPTTKPDSESGWSGEDPKVDGVYWWRVGDDNEPEYIHSVVNGRFYEMGASLSQTVKNFGGEWPEGGRDDQAIEELLDEVNEIKATLPDPEPEVDALKRWLS